MDLEHDGKIHWHEFIAATLSKCEYDERNLKLAFDRLDFDHQGFITKENLMDIVGTDQTESEVQEMFDEVDYKHEGKIYFPEFVAIMKQNNQPKSAELGQRRKSNFISGRRVSMATGMRGPVVMPVIVDVAEKDNKDKFSMRNEFEMRIHEHVQTKPSKEK